MDTNELPTPENRRLVSSDLLAALRASADAERAFGNQHAELLTQAADALEKLTDALRKIADGEEDDPHALSWGRRTMEAHELREIASSALANSGDVPRPLGTDSRKET
jgi:hypothetical protein